MGEFKDFLINENSIHLGHKMGDILNAMQELEEEGQNMGKRQVVKHSERLVSMIRRILHSNWPKKNQRHLEGLQKVGVAIMKTIEEKGELSDLLPSANSELQKILSDMKVPINQVGTPDGDRAKDKDSVDKEMHDKENAPPTAPPDGDGQSPPGQPMPQDATMDQMPPAAPNAGPGAQVPPQPAPPM